MCMYRMKQKSRHDAYVLHAACVQSAILAAKETVRRRKGCVGETHLHTLRRPKAFRPKALRPKALRPEALRPKALRPKALTWAVS